MELADESGGAGRSQQIGVWGRLQTLVEGLRQLLT
jgi:hypothetical protein